MTLPDVLRAINTGGVIAILVIIIYGGIKRWWVFGWLYDAMVKDRDQWQAHALRGTDLAEKTVDAAEQGITERLAAQAALEELLARSAALGVDSVKKKPNRRRSKKQ